MPSESPENPIPEENSILASPQEPTIDAPIPPNTSEPAPVPPVTPESSTEDESVVPVNTDNPEIEPESSSVEQTAPTENLSSNQPISEASTQPTAQVPVSEPFAKLSLLAKAREAIQFRKRKKLEKIMGMFLKQSSITNDEVEKLLHISDATATRYLEQLEKEGQVKQEGRTGKSVSYSKM